MLSELHKKILEGKMDDKLPKIISDIRAFQEHDGIADFEEVTLMLASQRLNSMKMRRALFNYESSLN